jgi:hypothetical protein
MLEFNQTIKEGLPIYSPKVSIIELVVSLNEKLEPPFTSQRPGRRPPSNYFYYLSID